MLEHAEIRLAGHAVGARDGQRVAAHASRVRLGTEVAGVDRGAEGLERAAIRLLQGPQRRFEIAGGLGHPAFEEPLVLAPLDQEGPVLERALGGVEELLHVDGLEDEVVGAVLEALHRGLDVAHAGEDQEGRVGVQRACLLQELDASQGGHLHVGDGEGRPELLEERQALLAVDRLPALEARALEELGQHPADLPVVVHDEDAAVKGGLAHEVWPPWRGATSSNTDTRFFPERLAA